MIDYDWTTVDWLRYSENTGHETRSNAHYTKDQNGWSDRTLCGLRIPNTIEGVVEVDRGVGTSRLCGRCERAFVAMWRRLDTEQESTEIKALFSSGIVNIHEVIEARGCTMKEAKTLLNKIARQDSIGTNFWRIKREHQ